MEWEQLTENIHGSIYLLHTKIHVFSDFVLCLGKVTENLQSNIVVGKKIEVVLKFTVTFKIERNTRKIPWADNGTELQSKWCWHLQKAPTQSSDPWVHCPEERSKAKVVENYQYTIAPTRERLKLFVAQFFLLTSGYDLLRPSQRRPGVVLWCVVCVLCVCCVCLCVLCCVCVVVWHLNPKTHPKNPQNPKNLPKPPQTSQNPPKPPQKTKTTPSKKKKTKKQNKNKKKKNPTKPPSSFHPKKKKTPKPWNPENPKNPKNPEPWTKNLKTP